MRKLRELNKSTDLRLVNQIRRFSWSSPTINLFTSISICIDASSIIKGGALVLGAYFGIGWLGFGSAGVAKGSVAAAVQSTVHGGAVPAKGLFATLQSLGTSGLTWKTGSALVYNFYDSFVDNVCSCQ